MNEPINAAMYRYHIQQLAKREQPKTIVEVGVYCGDLSRLLASIKSVEQLILVDPWVANMGKTQEHMDLIAQSVYAWGTTDRKVRIMRMDSVEAARNVPDQSVNFFHLDGEHTFESVSWDLEAWRPKMMKGSLMTGDNYEIEAVKKAVKATFGGKVSEEGKGRIWIVRV